jgi:hypothetical protein
VYLLFVPIVTSIFFAIRLHRKSLQTESSGRKYRHFAFALILAAVAAGSLPGVAGGSPLCRSMSVGSQTVSPSATIEQRTQFRSAECVTYTYDAPHLLRFSLTSIATKAVPCASFRVDTLVLMADGTKKPIGEIEVGDKVVATDPVTGKTSVRTITKLWTHIDDDSSTSLF